MTLRKAIYVPFAALLASAMWAQQPDAKPAPSPQASAEQEKGQAKETDSNKDNDQEQDKAAESTKKRLEGLACGPKDVHHSVHGDKSGKPPEQPADKALVFVIRPTHIGAAIQTKLAVDGKWVGVNKANNYFYMVLDPGPHYFCSQAENRSLLSLVVEPGKTYYLQQKIRMGMFKAGNDLALLDEKAGKEGLSKCHLTTMQEEQ